MFESIENFNEDNAAFEIIRVCDLAIHDLTRDNISHLQHKFKITQDGKYGEFTFSICLQGGKTTEQMHLNAYISRNPHYCLNLNKLFISKKGKVYVLWGYNNKKSKEPFILGNVNNLYETILMDEENVLKYFT